MDLILRGSPNTGEEIREKKFNEVALARRVRERNLMFVVAVVLTITTNLLQAQKCILFMAFILLL